MSLPKDIQELVDVLQLAGWSKIDEDDLIYEIFYGNEYPEHDTGDYKVWNDHFDKICEELEVDHEEEGRLGCEAYGIIKIKEFYYKATWFPETMSNYGIKDRITEVKPVQKIVTVFEGV
ncbi:conserved hypothetical protein [Vibrio phage 193E37-1]|nr:conserved hypothetical protein [Vibrio phage 193E37-1]